MSHIIETIHIQARQKRVAQTANELWMLWKSDDLDAVEDAVRQGMESILRDAQESLEARE